MAAHGPLDELHEKQLKTAIGGWRCILCAHWTLQRPTDAEVSPCAGNGQKASPQKYKQTQRFLAGVDGGGGQVERGQRIHFAIVAQVGGVDECEQ